MSISVDGSYVCDSCGVGVGNGNVRECAIISDIVPDGIYSRPRILHICRAERDDAPNGCVGNILNAETLVYWTENN